WLRPDPGKAPGATETQRQNCRPELGLYGQRCQGPALYAGERGRPERPARRLYQEPPARGRRLPHQRAAGREARLPQRPERKNHSALGKQLLQQPTDAEQVPARRGEGKGILRDKPRGGWPVSDHAAAVRAQIQ
nr:hypothetical protein [Tanacetum cinerariifolium]